MANLLSTTINGDLSITGNTSYNKISIDDLIVKSSINATTINSTNINSTDIVASNNITGKILISHALETDNVSPIMVNSKVLCTNLNAEYLDGYNANGLVTYVKKQIEESTEATQYAEFNEIISGCVYIDEKASRHVVDKITLSFSLNNDCYPIENSGPEEIVGEKIIKLDEDSTSILSPSYSYGGYRFICTGSATIKIDDTGVINNNKIRVIRILLKAGTDNEGNVNEIKIIKNSNDGSKVYWGHGIYDLSSDTVPTFSGNLFDLVELTSFDNCKNWYATIIGKGFKEVE